MSIAKSLKTKAGFPHRVHRSREGRKPTLKYYGQKLARRNLDRLRKKGDKYNHDA